ncbi:competence protein, partial [Lactobacillus crispatus]
MCFFVQTNHTRKELLFLMFKEINLRNHSSLHKLFYSLQRKYLRQQIMQKKKLGLKIGEMLYERKLTLDDLPDKVFATWRNPGERDRVSDFLQK